MKCDDFLTASNYKMKHDILKHYKEGRDIVLEEKPLDIIKTNSILKHEITANNFGEYNDFENAEEVVDEFLKSVYLKFKQAGLYLLNVVLLLKIFNSLF